MDYHKIRIQEIKLKNLDQAKKLAHKYDPDHKTIILLPGGGGSLLKRTTKRFDKPSPVPFKYDDVWIDKGIFPPTKDALKLKIDADGRDKGSRIIRADGALDYLIVVYDGTKKYFKLRDYNYFEYGFDWRRPLSECANLLEEFLAEFKNLVMSTGEANPLSNTTLICHSHGGLIATLFLQNIFHGETVNSSKVGEWIDKVITVATPFYANSGQIKRYYIGEKKLHLLLYDKKELAKIMGSMPGPYIFLYLDKETFDRDGAKLGLSEYPMIDADDPNIELDPYDPNSKNRFPSWVSSKYLLDAKKARHKYTRTLPKAVRDRIYHIRGVENNKTANRLRWKRISHPYDPYLQKVPIKVTKEDRGPGDGTVPAWAARLAQIPDDRVYDLKKAKKHMDLMEHEETLNVIRFIVENNRLPKYMAVKNTKFLGVKAASYGTLKNFMHDLQDGTIKITDKEASDPKIWRAIIEDMST